MTMGNSSSGGAGPGDERLARLFDYTKWHIGIYLSLGGGLVTLLATHDGNDFLCRLIALPGLLGGALVAMLVAGIAGGIIASAATRCTEFDQLWTQRRKVYGRDTYTGETWACIEHSAFWLGLALLAGSILGPVYPPRKCCQHVCTASATQSPIHK